MDKASLQRILMSIGAVVLIIVARKYFPNAADDVVALLGQTGLLVGAGGLLGAAHVTKPGDQAGGSSASQ